MQNVPQSFPVQPLPRGHKCATAATCGTCGRSWDDSISTAHTPAPSGRCPFEYFHGPERTYAQIVCDLIAENAPVAVSMSMGYMVTRKNARVNFSDHYGNGAWNPPRIIGEKHNRAGRCTSATAVYSDGSRLRFTWSQSRGSHWRVIGGH